MQQKGKKMIGIRKKIIIPIVIINIIMCLAMVVSIYSHVRSNFIEQGGSEALSISKLTSCLIDGDDIHNLAQTKIKGDAYDKIVELLDNVQKNTGSEYVYIIGESDGSLKYIVDTSIEEQDFFDEIEPEYAKELEATLAGEEYYTTEIDKSEYGTLLTAYTPLYDSNGTIVAALAIDYDATHIVSMLRTLIITLAVFGSVITMIAVAIILFIVNKILHGLQVIDHKLTELTSNNGDLTQRIEIKTSDEIGSIGKQLNGLFEYIWGIIHNISGMASELTDSIKATQEMMIESSQEVGIVSSTMQDMSAMMEQTCANVEQITSTIQEMKVSVTNIYQQVEAGLSLSEDIHGHADKIVEKADMETEQIRNVTNQLTTSMQEKIQRSNEVNQIEELSRKILDIADQTSLLALNASIEAARAGESGRGFTVVAEQISQLSNSSATIAKEIQNISMLVINSVSDLAKESETMIEFIYDKTVGGYEELLQVGTDYLTNSTKIEEAFTTLKMHMKQLDQGMTTITQAAVEVNDAVTENTRGINEGAENASQINASIQKTSEYTNTNLETMSELMNEVNKFVI